MSENELNLNEQEKTKQLNKKVKEWIKRILFGAFCIAIILLMVFGLLSGVIFNKDEENSSSDSHAHAIVNIID